jgi:hypothetical protein
MRAYSRQALMAVAVLVALAIPGSAFAQAGLAAADATAFLGAWTLGLDTPQGALSMELTIKDEAGKVTGTISAEPMVPGVAKITDITKAGTNLVLKYMLEVQGMQIPTVITLTPDGDKWKANFDFADGQFSTAGTAAKKG